MVVAGSLAADVLLWATALTQDWDKTSDTGHIYGQSEFEDIGSR